MSTEQYKNCKNCPHVKCKPSITSNTNSAITREWEDVCCNHSSRGEFGERIIEYYLSKDKPCNPPSWCPLNVQKKVYKTYSEKQACLNAAEPTINWDEIEVGELYHVPPLNREKRTDWYVIEHTKTFIRIKEITDIETQKGYTRYIYTSNPSWKFMVKHRMLENLDEIKEKIKKDVEDYLSPSTKTYSTY